MLDDLIQPQQCLFLVFGRYRVGRHDLLLDASRQSRVRASRQHVDGALYGEARQTRRHERLARHLGQRVGGRHKQHRLLVQEGRNHLQQK